MNEKEDKFYYYFWMISAMLSKKVMMIPFYGSIARTTAKRIFLECMENLKYCKKFPISKSMINKQSMLKSLHRLKSEKDFNKMKAIALMLYKY